MLFSESLQDTASTFDAETFLSKDCWSSSREILGWILISIKSDCLSATVTSICHHTVNNSEKKSVLSCQYWFQYCLIELNSWYLKELFQISMPPRDSPHYLKLIFKLRTPYLSINYSVNPGKGINFHRLRWTKTFCHHRSRRLAVKI